MVLTKKSYNNVIGKIEKKQLYEKINFLKNIPVFHSLTRTSLGKMTMSFFSKTCIKDSYLYKEGQPADCVYIVKSGEFQATKRLIHMGVKEENIQEIRENPMKANKTQNKLFNRNTTRKVETINVSSNDVTAKALLRGPRKPYWRGGCGLS